MAGIERLLIVEDDPADQVLLETAVRGFAPMAQVRVVDGLEGALRALAAERFDCALVDVNLGGDAVEQLFARVSESDGPALVAVSGRGDEVIAARCIKAGAQDYLPKGDVEPERLGIAVRHALSVRARLRARAQASRRTSFLALHDPLTELLNRAGFQDSLRAALERAARSGVTVAVLTLDLDRFKPVNDRFGHDAGDELLRALAGRIRGVVRRTDAVARLGGDEFAVLLEPAPAPDRMAWIADKIVAAVSEPVTLTASGAIVAVSASIGIAAADATDLDARSLLQRSDEALYAAKRKGRGVVRFYDQVMDAQARLRAEMRCTLQAAVRDGALQIACQPIVDLESRRPVGHELLLRWDHERAGAVAPAHFLPLIEEMGLLPIVGNWTLQEACRLLASAPLDPDGHGGEPPFLTVNLSLSQLRQPDLVPRIRGLLDEYGLEPRRLHFDVPDAVLLEDDADVVYAIGCLRELGCAVMIDDFGRGPVHLEQLARLPVDGIKLDPACLPRPDSRRSVATARAFFSFARDLDLVCIAEGIESGMQLAALRALGCGLGQGRYLGAPVRTAPASRDAA